MRRRLASLWPVLFTAAIGLSAGWVSGSPLPGPAQPPPVQAGELLRDPTFSRGWAVLAPKAGQGELGRIQAVGVSSAPVWQLAQWHSRFPFTNGTLPGPSGCLSNQAKCFCVDLRAAAGPTLTLGVDSRPEYRGRLRRSAAEPWVHLLVQQALTETPPLTELKALRLRANVCLDRAETFRPEGYSPALHAAQFQIVFTLNNTRRGSPGYGDYLWFVVPVYDDRYELPPEYIAPDFAVAGGKLIYNPGGAALGLKPLRRGQWQTLDCDLRPWLERALREAWAKGYLGGSRAPADYRVAHVNFGWEVPGLNRVAMRIADVSLRAQIQH